MYWWRHSNKIGQYSSAKVHNSIKIILRPGVELPASMDDYIIEQNNLAGLVPEIIEGM